MNCAKIQKSWPVFLFVLGVTEPTLAAEKLCDPDYPARCSQPMEQGDVAPFHGQLVSPELAIALGQKATHCERLVEVEKERTTGLVRVERELGQDKLTICNEASEKKVEFLEQQLEPPPFWKSPWFTVPVTAVTTAAVLAGAWWLAIETVKATK